MRVRGMKGLAVAILSVLASSTALTAQIATINTRAVKLPTITGVEVVSLGAAQGWPQHLRFYSAQAAYPTVLLVGVANLGQVDDVRIIDKSSHPVQNFETSFASAPTPDCPTGTTFCVRVELKPNGANPGAYRIGVVSAGELLEVNPAVEVVCDPRTRPIRVTLDRQEQRVSQGTTLNGRVVLACPALPETVEVGGRLTGATSVTVTRNIQGRGLSNELILANGLLTYPGAVTIPPGQSSATFQITSPQHLEGRGQAVHALARVPADLRATLLGPGGQALTADASARFVYPNLSSVSIPTEIVGSDALTGNVELDQSSDRDEQVCFSVRGPNGAPLGTAGHRFDITAPDGTTGPCVTIARGRTAASFQLTPQLSASSTGPASFVLRGVRQHRDAGAHSGSLDTLQVAFRAWPTPALDRMTLWAPPSQPTRPGPYVDGSTAGQVSGYVSLVSAAPPGGQSVTLKCKSTDRTGERLCAAHLSFPERVTIPQGSREYGFHIEVSPSSVEGVVALVAQLDGRETGTPLHFDLPPEVATVGLTTAGSGFRVAAIWVTDVVRVAPLRVALKMSGEAAKYLQLPQFVDIPVGELSVNVNVPVAALPKPLEVTLTAARVASKVAISKTVVIQP